MKLNAKQFGWTMIELLLVIVTACSIAAITVYSVYADVNKQQNIQHVVSLVNEVAQASHQWRLAQPVAMYVKTRNPQVNYYNLNYSGIAIEGDKSRYDLCVKNYKLYPNVKVYHGMVVPFSSNKDQPQYNLDKWLSIGDAPKDLDILSIDIDGDDYYVWDEMVEFSPKIVIFEVNSYRDPVFDELPNQPSTEYNIDLLKMQIPQRVAFGCSFMSAIKLGLKKGFILVQANHLMMTYLLRIS